MRTNRKNVPSARTHEGAPAVVSSPAKELRRSIMACMLFEGQFYESGVDHAARVSDLCKRVSFEDLAQTAIDAREKFKLRHVPLLLVREAIRHHNGRKVGDLIARVIQRPDELGELMALYRKDGKGEPAQLKIGLARAFKKFSPYQLAKYDRSNVDFRLRDVLFLSHVRPRDEAQAVVFKSLVDNTLQAPDTWEVALSQGGQVTNMDQAAFKKLTFERLMVENKLGALALLRNLRGMLEAGVSEDKIRAALEIMNAERVLPFRFISAARAAPRLEDALELAMFRCMAQIPKLGGKTALLIDHSQSMERKVSEQSEISRFDAAAALAVILRELADRCRVFTFSDFCVEVPPRRGFAMIQAVKEVVNPKATLLGKAVRYVYSEFPECDRIIVVTDEQSEDRPPHPQGTGYIVNVGGYQNGIAYGPWVSIDGWSEAVIEYIRESEAAEA